MDRDFVYESCPSFMYKKYFRGVCQMGTPKKYYVTNYISS